MQYLQSDLEKILQRYWGYPTFRPDQSVVISAILRNPGTIALMATSGGKSICYQVAGLYLGGLTIVISPLISLIQDQVSKLESLGIPARMYTSSLDNATRNRVLDDCYARKVSFLYLAPEALSSKSMLSLVPDLDCRLVVVDEAHCISMWGQDFRPAYLRIGHFHKSLTPSAKLVAVTATATDLVVKDICTQLHINRHDLVRGNLSRSNLAIRVLRHTNTDAVINAISDTTVRGSTLVYAATRLLVEEIAGRLLSKGFRVGYYHAGLPPKERQNIQEQFLANELQIVVATNAFGMGVDKPNIRAVFHTHLPASVEDYFQEVGRAGRDGQESECLINLTWQSINRQKQRIRDSFVTPKLANEIYNYLCAKSSSLGKVRLDVQTFLREQPYINKSQLLSTLKAFTDAKIADYSIDSDKIQVNLFEPHILFLSRWIDFPAQRQLHDRRLLRLKNLLQVLLTEKCRVKSIMEYFGQTVPNCGKCDICV